MPAARPMRAPLRIGVFPAAARAARPRLLAALETAYPVVFESRGGTELRDLDALLELGGAERAREAAEAGLPALALLRDEPSSPRESAELRIGPAHELHRALRGARLADRRLGSLPPGAASAGVAGATVLAARAGAPVWTRQGRLRTAPLAPGELGKEEPLRERLCEARSAALVPLVHFLWELTRPIAWQPPPLRASLLFDDPNLHWPSYGYADLRALSRHAREHGCHVALATIPLDAWLAQRGALRAVTESGGAISLLAHGNNHDGAELGRVRDGGEAVALAAQASRRLTAFERRTGVRVDRVMVPPHEECSAAAVDGLRRCGFAAISMTRPFPWLAPRPRNWLTAPAAADALVGWRPGGFTRGLPLLLRHPLGCRSQADLALRAFLGQPLILYGHHADLREGLDDLGIAAAELNRLGARRWTRLAEIAAGAYETRPSGSLLGIRLLTTRAELTVPPRVESVRVELPPDYDGPHHTALTVSGRPASLAEPVAVRPGAKLTIELRAPDRVDTGSAPPPRRRPLALARRLAGESRDRAVPLLRRGRP